MLVHYYPGVGCGVRESTDPLNSPPEVVAVEDSGQAEVGGLGRATAAAMDAIARAGGSMMVASEGWYE